MKLFEKTPAQQLLQNFCDAYKNRDLNYLLSLFTENINLWGTAIDEYRYGLDELAAQLQRDWSQSERGEIQIESYVQTPPNANWAAAICKTILWINGKEHVFEHLRGTAIVEKRNDVWKISHFHCSFPDSRNPEGGSFPLG